MRLQRLELFGFKSFADRTLLSFERSFTGIVGPNGCGKWNVVDAIRWVLGETRPTSMRGGEMSDVIFKGSVSRPAMGVAEVTLVLDNSTGTIAGQGAEVAITRRVFRSGEGEYLINGERVRLKDVRDMLFDTGLGSRGYAVLEQGKIDAVLSANPLDRRAIWLAQPPQAFRRAILVEAYAAAGPRAAAATDEAQLVEWAGHPVTLVAGEPENFKVTNPDDLDRARARVEPLTAVGFGLDVHAFAEGRRCVLGGIEFPGEVGLEGHSDADAVLHALMDAILGAAGLGDIGQHFPDNDARFRGADSARLLEEVLVRARAAGFEVGNADLTIAAARPKIAPRRDEMRRRIATLLEVPEARVNVKATTTEGLGFIGRSEGIAAQAVVLLTRR